MRTLSPFLAALCAASLTAAAAMAWTPPQPAPVTPRHLQREIRRDAIHRELDGNHDAVKHLYGMLDATPKEEASERAFLESEIHQFDQRNALLFEELEELDKRDFEATRRTELAIQASRLEDEAVQLRKSKLLLPAAIREAKARSIRRSLMDGGWNQLVADEWECDPNEPDLATTIQLAVEVQKLKKEAAAMRKEISRLSSLVEKTVDSPITPESAPKNSK